MAKRTNNEVKESLLQLTRIYKPNDPRKFVREFVKKYRVTGGYEEEMVTLVCKELKIKVPGA